MRSTSSSASRRLPGAFMLLILTTGCAGRAPAQAAGVLTVGVSTTGAGGAGLTFDVEVSSTRRDADTQLTGRVNADGGIATFRDLSGAPYVVRLSLPSQCEAEGGTSRRIVVAPRRTSAVRFAVRCR